MCVPKCDAQYKVISFCVIVSIHFDRGGVLSLQVDIVVDKLPTEDNGDTNPFEMSLTM